MPEAKVEKFRLTPEQMKFSKDYKEATKLHKILSTEFKQRLTDADQLRQALTEVEVSMAALTDRAKGFNFEKLDGQENIPAPPEQSQMPGGQMPAGQMPGGQAPPMATQGMESSYE